MNFRLMIAILATIVMISLGIFEEIYVCKVFTDFEGQLTELEASEENNLQDLDVAIKWWEKHHNALELFLPHVPLNEIFITLGELRGAYIMNDNNLIKELFQRLSFNVTAVADTFGIRIQNII